MNVRPDRRPLYGAALYLVLGAAWIAFSDALLAALVSDPVRLTLYQTYKGWTYVALTGLLAYLLLDRAVAGENARRVAEERLRLAAKAANVGLWDWDLATNQVHYSPEWKSQIGYADQEISDDFEEWRSRVHPDDLPGVLTRVQAYLDDPGSEYRNEFRLRHRDGSYRWILAQGASFKEDGAGRPRRMLGSHLDITERKAAEQVLRDSEARFRQLFDLSPVPLCFVGRNGVLLDFNERFERTFGYSYEEIPTLNEWWPLAYPDPDYRRRVMETWDAAVQRAAETRTDIEPIAYRVTCKDGQERTVEISGIILGEGFLATFFDVTERNRANAAAAELLERLRMLAAHVPGVLAQYRMRPDGSSHFPYASGGLKDIYGCTPEEVADDAAPVFAAIHPDDLDHVVETIRQSAETLRPWWDEHRVNLPDGRTIWVQGHSTPIRAEDGSITWNGYVRDITELKRAEAALKKAYADVERKVVERTAELAAANERLKDLDRLKSLFIASMSHELRTPLNSIIGFTGLLLMDAAGPLNDQQRDHLGRVKSSGQHLLNLITDVIDVSKIEAGKVQAHPETFPLGALVEEAVGAITPQIGQKGLRISAEITEMALTTDRRRLLQCLLNYLSNAVKYSAVGEIRVTGVREDKHLRLQVQDQGIGIAPDDIPRLFQQFSRIDSPITRTTLGTGLGLYLTRKIAGELLGGEVGLESEPGKGSRFWLRVPLEAARADEPAGADPGQSV